MKNLYLIRHAKASWEEAHLPDFERPLTEVGEQDAREIGQQLRTLAIVPDYMLASSAIRAINTARIIAETLDFPLDRIVTDEHIYSSGVEELVERIKGIERKFNTVLCVGHNPSLTWLAHYLCEDAKMNIPTCGVVGIRFEMRNWSEIASAEGQLATFIHPQHEQP